MTLRRIFALFFLSLLAAHAQFSLPFDGEDGADGPGAAKTSASLIAENRSIAPGKPFTVLLELKHPAGWHSYFVNPGNVGEIPQIQWTLPEGFKAGDIQWPLPHLGGMEGFRAYDYEGTVRLPVTITPPANLQADSAVALKASAKWQICSDTGCIPENAELSLKLPVSADAQIDPANAKAFEEARAALPLKTNTWTANVSTEGKTLIIKLKSASGTAEQPQELYLFNIDRQLNADTPQAVTWKDGTAEVRVARADDAKPLTTFSAIAYASNGWVKDAPQKGLLIENAPIATAADANAPAPAKSGELLGILGGMLLGGLILNLMPCVFPVIGLKILGFVQHAGEDRRKVMLHGVIFSLGVFLSFAVLSGILFAVRAATHAEVGWGYQLQNPWFVLIMLLLMLFFALNMAGVFEIGTSATSIGGKLSNKHGLAGSFFSGVLATIVATPCSAPFLGPAIGAAISLPAAQFFASFAAMALGLTLPYLVLSSFPKLTDMLPRPGAWMESFKQGMSFLLFGTAGYLLWVYIGQIKLENSLNALLGLAVIAFGTWVYGRWNLPYRSRKARTIGCTVALAAILSGCILVKPPKPSGLEWEHWSQQRVDELLAKGKPVYVDFTASWCLTCQVNKKRAYTPEVIKLMKERGIVTLKADKSSPDPAIDAKIAEFKRTAIPVNVLYVPGKAPIVTPEVLSPSYLKELIEKEVPKKK